MVGVYFSGNFLLFSGQNLGELFFTSVNSTNFAIFGKIRQCAMFCDIKT